MDGSVLFGLEDLAAQDTLRLLHAVALGGPAVGELEASLEAGADGVDYQAASLRVGGQSIDAARARRLFEALAAHRLELQNRLERPVALRTAAMDLSLGLESAFGLHHETGGPSYEELLSLAFRDPLTDLHNLRYFKQRFEEEIHRASRYRHPVSLIMLDIDHFKHFNDTHGHPAGNQALTQLARILTKESRETDLVARYGGEEFAYLLPETTKRRANELAERVRARVESTSIVLANGEHHFMTVSLGSATFPRDSASGANLVDAADQALYAAKRKGRNRVSMYRPTTHADFSFSPKEPPTESVYVVGSFNAWDKRADPMTQHADGVWRGRVAMVPGTYQYKFVIDGAIWLSDPNCAEAVSDGYWGENSILRVTKGPGQQS